MIKPAKKQITEDRVDPILKSTHMISVLANMIKIEHRDRIFDTRFKLPVTNNFANRILESASGIESALTVQFKLIDRDKMKYDESLVMWKIVDHFLDLGPERCEEFMDALEKLKEQNKLNN